MQSRFIGGRLEGSHASLSSQEDGPGGWVPPPDRAYISLSVRHQHESIVNHQRTVVLRRQIPNLLTLLRFPLTGVFLYGSFRGDLGWELIATVAFIVSMITDALDGRLARRYDVVSDMGTFLDPLADKVLVLSGFFVLLARPDLNWGAWYPWMLGSVVVIAFRELSITVLRMARSAASKPLVTSIWGKAKTTVQMVTLVAGLLLLNLRDLLARDTEIFLPVIAFGILASALLALLSGIDYFRGILRSGGNGPLA